MCSRLRLDRDFFKNPAVFYRGSLWTISSILRLQSPALDTPHTVVRASPSEFHATVREDLAEKWPESFWGYASLEFDLDEVCGIGRAA